MNVNDMTDAEIYERGIEILLDRLGPAGLVQFLRQCKPCTGDYTAERQKWINDDTTDVKTIVKRIQEKQKRVVAKNVNPKSVDDMSDMEIYEFGLKAISLKLGPVGVVRFVHLFDADGYTHMLARFKLPNINAPDPKRIKESETESA